MTDLNSQPRRVIHLDEIDPGVRERAFGDGLTAEQRFREQMARWLTPVQLDAMAASMMRDMEALVARGEATPIVGPNGIVGWDAGNAPNIVTNPRK